MELLEDVVEYAGERKPERGSGACITLEEERQERKFPVCETTCSWEVDAVLFCL